MLFVEHVQRVKLFGNRCNEFFLFRKICNGLNLLIKYNGLNGFGMGYTCWKTCNGISFLEHAHWVHFFGNMCNGCNLLDNGELCYFGGKVCNSKSNKCHIVFIDFNRVLRCVLKQICVLCVENTSRARVECVLTYV